MIVLLLAPGVAHAAGDETLSAIAILNDRVALDGKTVALEGEVIGEALHADEGGVWLSVLSAETAMGVFIPAGMAEPITTFGDYKHTGDTVRVVGEFNRACNQHGGDMDIHAESLIVVAPGERREHPVELWKFGLAFLGFATAGASYAYTRWKRRVIEGG